ncbi:MAG: hypothetical protein WBL51_02905 [Acidimicrobiales bacterium]
MNREERRSHERKQYCSGEFTKVQPRPSYRGIEHIKICQFSNGIELARCLNDALSVRTASFTAVHG